MTNWLVANDDPDIDSVWLWFEFQKSLIGKERERSLRMLQPTYDIAREYRLESQVIGLTSLEVEEFFEAQRKQLDLLIMFELLAITEAILRIDFKARVGARRKDGLSRRFRKLQQESGDKIRLDEDILGAMKEEGVAASIVAAGRGVLKLRHWLAHGRHWHPKLGRGYSPNDVFDIAKALIRSIPILEPIES